MITPAATANENARLRTLLYRFAITTEQGLIYTCQVCGNKVLGDRADLTHLPGCVFAGQPRETLANYEAFEISEGEKI